MEGCAPRIGADQDESADLEALFGREHDPMLRLAVLLVGSRAHAEEIVSEAFLVVGQRWDGLDNPGGYLRTVVVNGCHSALRRREVEQRHASIELDPRDPFELVELQCALDQLRPDHRTALVLRYFAGVEDAAIAEILGCRPATVRSHVHRGLRRLRKELT